MASYVTVGVDGSPESLAAADWGAREALRTGRPLRLVHVRDPGPYPDIPLVDEDAQRVWSDDALRDAAAALAESHPQLEVEREQLAGRASRALAEAADGSALLVLGSRGLGSVAGFVLGSVAAATLARTRCPTVLVRADPAPDEGRPVLLGLDLDEPSGELLAFGFDAAARRAVPLRVVHAFVLPLVFGVRPAQVDPALVARVTEDRSYALRELLRPWRERYPETEVREETVHDRPATRLVEAAPDASLVVVGRRLRRAPVGAHIGPVAHALMHHSRTPVAVVPYPPPE